MNINLKKIGAVFLVVYVVFITLAWWESPTTDQLYACQNLTLELDEILEQVSEDYTEYDLVLADWADELITDDKFFSSIENLYDNYDRLQEAYDEALEQYNDECFPQE